MQLVSGDGSRCGSLTQNEVASLLQLLYEVGIGGAHLLQVKRSEQQPELQQINDTKRVLLSGTEGETGGRYTNDMLVHR